MSSGIVRARVEAAVVTAIRKLGVEEVDLLPVHDLQLDLGIDSTELVELAAIVRGELGLTAHRVDLGRLRTVGDLVSQLDAMLRDMSRRGTGA
jgi:acyl carrier protein